MAHSVGRELVKTMQPHTGLHLSYELEYRISIVAEICLVFAANELQI
jgi:hypothetical protein